MGPLHPHRLRECRGRSREAGVAIGLPIGRLLGSVNSRCRGRLCEKPLGLGRYRDRATDEPAERARVFLVHARALCRTVRFDVRLDACLRRGSGEGCVDYACYARQTCLRERSEQNPDTKNAANASNH